MIHFVSGLAFAVTTGENDLLISWKETGAYPSRTERSDNPWNRLDVYIALLYSSLLGIGYCFCVG